MRKKIALVILLALTITACSKPKEPEEPKVPKEPDVVETTNVEKLDKDKPYVYSELYNEEIDVMSLIKDVDPNSEILKTLSFSLIPRLVSEGYMDQKESIGVNEKIYVNINSEDARTIQKTLDEALEVANDLMTDRYKEIKESGGQPDVGGSFANQVLLNVVETDRFISFTVSNMNIRLYSDASLRRIETYVLSKTEGRLLSPEEILNESGYTLNEVEDFVREEILNYEEEAFYEPDMVSEAESLILDDYRNIVFLNYDNPFILTEDALIVSTSIYYPQGLGIEGTLSYIAKPYKKNIVQKGDVNKVLEEKDYVTSDLIISNFFSEEIESERVYVNLDSDDARIINMKFDHQMRMHPNFSRVLKDVILNNATVTFIVEDSFELNQLDVYERIVIKQTMSFDLKTGILLDYNQLFE